MADSSSKKRKRSQKKESEKDDEGEAYTNSGYCPTCGTKKRKQGKSKKEKPREKNGKRENFASGQVAVMKKWLEDHWDDPYPSAGAKSKLARETGLTYEQVQHWFINARMRYWRPELEKRKVEPEKKQKGKKEVSDKPIKKSPKRKEKKGSRNSEGGNSRGDETSPKEKKEVSPTGLEALASVSEESSQVGKRVRKPTLRKDQKLPTFTKPSRGRAAKKEKSDKDTGEVKGEEEESEMDTSPIHKTDTQREEKSLGIPSSGCVLPPGGSAADVRPLPLFPSNPQAQSGPPIFAFVPVKLSGGMASLMSAPSLGAGSVLPNSAIGTSTPGEGGSKVQTFKWVPLSTQPRPVSD